uniref:Anthocyanidin 3-O-glucoside 2''-O-glucosyltransferase n=1 Tax=Opuntia streptacantha TaxID=393608 RepID=A0A7C8ZE68_OPUST
MGVTGNGNGNGTGARKTKLHVVMFPWFAFGHINPFIQLSNKLTSYGIQISFFSIPGNIPRIKSSLNLSPPNQIIPLAVPPVEGLSPNVDSSSFLPPQIYGLLSQALDQMQPQVKTLLTQLQPDIVFFDFVQHWLPPLASELGIKSANFSVFSAVANSYLVVPSRMPDPNQPPTIEDLKKPPPGFPETSVTGVRTFQAQDFMFLFKGSNGGAPAFERTMGYIKTSDAVIYKSCVEFEGPYIDYLKTQLGKPLLLAGPAVPMPPSGILEAKWAKWLDNFLETSVIFCNFGSETYLDGAQIEELAVGLELTGLPFFLVLNFGIGGDAAEAKLEASLPKGFRDRVKDRGVVHTGWVQQQHILAHKSVGCYLNHSGFSSVIEALVNDCQLILIPQKGDQYMNSKLLSGDLKVGVEVNRRDADGYFGKEDILKAVQTVMLDIDKEPGKSIRAHHKKWKEFLLKKDIEDKYIANLVRELEALAHDA